MSSDLALFFRGKSYERGQTDDIVYFEVGEITEVGVDESHPVRLAKLVYQMPAEFEGLPVDFQVIDGQLKTVAEEHRGDGHRSGAREQKSIRGLAGECYDGMYLHGTKLHIVAIIRTMK
jgi:hypothetical protein